MVVQHTFGIDGWHHYSPPNALPSGSSQCQPDAVEFNRVWANARVGWTPLALDAARMGMAEGVAVKPVGLVGVSAEENLGGSVRRLDR